MNRDLHSKRENYKKFTLEDNQILNNPHKLFDEWYKIAENDIAILEPNCMSLSTILNNEVRNRIVLLKEFSSEGFVFYTNYNSKKGQAIAQNPKVGLHFFWPSLEKQIIINGIAEKISEEKSIAYFNSRPKGSQIGAIISNQSNEIKNRKELESKIKDLEQLDILEKPKHWGGYLIKPYLFEFWQGRENRLHDRIEFVYEDNLWTWKRLAP